MKEIVDLFEKTVEIGNILFSTTAVFAVIALYCLQVFPLHVNTFTSEKKFPFSCEMGLFEGGVHLEVHGSLKHTFFLKSKSCNLPVTNPSH